MSIKGKKTNVLCYFRKREENDIKKWIFKDISPGVWKGSLFDGFSSFKDCWDITGGFSTQELDIISGKQWECFNCKYKSTSLETFLYQVQKVNSEANNKLEILEKEIEEQKYKMKLLEKELQEEKNKNKILNEKINIIMNELKEIKAGVNEINYRK